MKAPFAEQTLPLDCLDSAVGAFNMVSATNAAIAGASGAGAGLVPVLPFARVFGISPAAITIPWMAGAGAASFVAGGFLDNYKHRDDDLAGALYGGASGAAAAGVTMANVGMRGVAATAALAPPMVPATTALAVSTTAMFTALGGAAGAAAGPRVTAAYGVDSMEDIHDRFIGPLEDRFNAFTAPLLSAYDAASERFHGLTDRLWGESAPLGDQRLSPDQVDLTGDPGGLFGATPWYSGEPSGDQQWGELEPMGGVTGVADTATLSDLPMAPGDDGVATYTNNQLVADAPRTETTDETSMYTAYNEDGYPPITDAVVETDQGGGSQFAGDYVDRAVSNEDTA
jgi:hypothetical protein